MPMKLVATDGGRTMTLAGRVDIFEAGALHALAREAVSHAPETVTVCLREVAAVDTSTTQILMALRRALAARGGTLRLEGVPADVAEHWRRLAADVETA